MEAVMLRAHFDGEKIVLDEPFDLEPNAKLVIMVMPDGQLDEDREDWSDLATQSLARAYSPDEPEYTLDMIREWNPEYDERR